MAANANATVFWIRSRNGELEQVEGDVVAVERLGLTERLCPKEADEVVPSFREAEPTLMAATSGASTSTARISPSRMVDGGPGRRAVALGVEI